MPSFDTVIEPDLIELRNAVEQAVKEIGTRFDFKGSSADVQLADRSAKDRELTLFGDSDFQLQQVRDVLLARLAKRGVDTRFLDFSATPQKLGGDRLKLAVPVKSGIDADTARKITALVKGSKIKVQSQVQGDSVRVTGAKRDELQAVIALLRKELHEMPLSFNNFRS
jgi:cyclic-di-GMP-binding protein